MDQSPNLTFEPIKSGDKKAFELVFKTMYKQLVNYAYRLVRDREESEEIVQQVFLSIWEKRKELTVQGAFENYLYRAVKNRCINYIKLELPKKQKLEDVEQIEFLISDQQKESNQAAHLHKKIDRAIGQLPEKCKEIFLLSRYGGLTYVEIAEELDISVKTVENQISIALKRLRELLPDISKK